MPSFSRSFKLGIAVPLAVFLIHLHSLGNGFHYDDGHSILRNPHIRSLTNLPLFFSDPAVFSENPEYAMYRPLVLVAHALNYAWGEYAPFGYQLLNLAVHCLAALCVYIILRQLRLPAEAALFGALVFGLHPVQTEPVNYVSSRSESLAGLFYLLAFSTYLQAERQPALSWFLFSLAAFTAALLSKATAITLPLILLACQWILHPVGPLRFPYRRHLPYWALAGAYLVLYRGLAGGGIDRAEQVRPYLSQLATQTKALVHYLKLALLPAGMNVHQQFWASPSLASAPVFFSLLAGLSLLGIALFHRTRRPLIVFGLVWFVLCLLPTLAVPLHILVNDHRLYLSLFGLALALAVLSTQVTPRWVLHSVCMLFALISFQRDQIWRDELSLWEDAVARAPLMPEAHYNLGHAHHQVGHLDPARQAYQRALELSPNYTRAQVNLGAVYRAEGAYDRAARLFESALKNEPTGIEALNNLGLVYRDMEKLNRAEEILQQALRLQPNLAETHFNLGLVYRDMGETEKAFQHLSRALQLKPELKQQFPQKP